MNYLVANAIAIALCSLRISWSVRSGSFRNELGEKRLATRDWTI